MALCCWWWCFHNHYLLQAQLTGEWQTVCSLVGPIVPQQKLCSFNLILSSFMILVKNGHQRARCILSSLVQYVAYALHRACIETKSTGICFFPYGWLSKSLDKQVPTPQNLYIPTLAGYVISSVIFSKQPIIQSMVMT